MAQHRPKHHVSCAPIRTLLPTTLSFTLQVSVALLSDRRYSLVLPEGATLRRLQAAVEKQTGVPPERQELFVAEQRQQGWLEQVGALCLCGCVGGLERSARVCAVLWQRAGCLFARFGVLHRGTDQSLHNKPD